MLLLSGIAGPLVGEYVHERTADSLEVPIGIAAAIGTPILFLVVGLLVLWAGSATVQRNDARRALGNSQEQQDGLGKEIEHLKAEVERNQREREVKIKPAPGGYAERVIASESNTLTPLGPEKRKLRDTKGRESRDG